MRITKTGETAQAINDRILMLIKELPEKYATAGAQLASELSPVSTPETNPRSTEPGYVHMRDAITAEPGGGDRIGANSWQVIVGKLYGIYVELGTIFMDAQPFFRPAMASIGRAMRIDFQSVVERALRRR